MKKAIAALALIAVGAAVGVGATILLVDDDGASTPNERAESTSGDQDDDGATGDGCDYADTSGCTPGAELVLDDEEWTCDRPLKAYASELGGSLPLKVTARFSTYVETTAATIDLTTGCRGDGTEAIDLILDVQGDGRSVGGLGDAVSVKLEATDIDITGNVDCGPRAPGGHQDGIQAHGANDIAFVDLEVGDWEEQRATCAAASGGIDISGGSGPSGLLPTDYRCIRCRVIACRRAINVGESVGVQVTDGRFRSGNPADLEEQLATGEVGLCNFQVSSCNVDAAARDSVFERNLCEEHPFQETSGRR